MPHASLKKSLLFVQFWAAHGFCKRVLNSRIWQHCDVKTSTVTPTFYYFFIITLTCYISVPSSSYNLCQVLLLWNHLNVLLIQLFDFISKYSGTSIKQRPRGLAYCVCYNEVSLYGGSFSHTLLFLGKRKSFVIPTTLL